MTIFRKILLGVLVIVGITAGAVGGLVNTNVVTKPVKSIKSPKLKAFVPPNKTVERIVNNWDKYDRCLSRSIKSRCESLRPKELKFN